MNNLLFPNPNCAQRKTPIPTFWRNSNIQMRAKRMDNWLWTLRHNLINSLYDWLVSHPNGFLKTDMCRWFFFFFIFRIFPHFPTEKLTVYIYSFFAHINGMGGGNATKIGTRGGKIWYEIIMRRNVGQVRCRLVFFF